MVRFRSIFFRVYRGRRANVLPPFPTYRWSKWNLIVVLRMSLGWLLIFKLCMISSITSLLLWAFQKIYFALLNYSKCASFLLPPSFLPTLLTPFTLSHWTRLNSKKNWQDLGEEKGLSTPLFGLNVVFFADDNLVSTQSQQEPVAV